MDVYKTPKMQYLAELILNSFKYTTFVTKKFIKDISNMNICYINLQLTYFINNGILNKIGDKYYLNRGITSNASL